MKKSSPKKQLNIQSLKLLAQELHTPLELLLEVAEEINSLYSVWEEPKPNGKFRTISSPKKKLKKIQKAIHNLLITIEPMDCWHCGIKNRSNVINAKVHSGQKWLLSYDFKDFFPSISYKMVFDMFRHKLNCSPPVAKILTRLSTFQKQVPQGAPMSMDIANLVCRPMDIALKFLAKKNHLNYTRYCDDIFFLGNHISDAFIDKAKKIIAQYPFTLNSDKELLRGNHEPQIVTGLSVNKKRPHFPRGKRREWRKEKFFCEKYDFKNLPEEAQIKRKQQFAGRDSYITYINNA